MFKKDDKVLMYRNKYAVTALPPRLNNCVFKVNKDEVEGEWVEVRDDESVKWFIPRSYLKRVKNALLCS